MSVTIMVTSVVTLGAGVILLPISVAYERSYIFIEDQIESLDLG